MSVILEKYKWYKTIFRLGKLLSSCSLYFLNQLWLCQSIRRACVSVVHLIVYVNGPISTISLRTKLVSVKFTTPTVYLFFWALLKIIELGLQRDDVWKGSWDREFFVFLTNNISYVYIYREETKKRRCLCSARIDQFQGNFNDNILCKLYKISLSSILPLNIILLYRLSSNSNTHTLPTFRNVNSKHHNISPSNRESIFVYMRMCECMRARVFDFYCCMLVCT